MVDFNKLRGISPFSSDMVNNEAQQKELKEKELTEKEKKKRDIIEKGIERARPDLKGPEKEKAKEVLQRVVDGENMPIDKSVEDFAFLVADSLQTIENEVAPKNEYFYWIEDAKEVIYNMTDGDITDADLDMRDDFLENLDVRETEMRVYMALYAASNSSKAKERLDFLQLKLAKLQQLRSAVVASTKSREEAERDRQLKEEEKRLAEEYQRMLEEEQRNQVYSDAEYKANLLMAQTLIAMAVVSEMNPADHLQRLRYQEYLAHRAEDLRFLNKISPNADLSEAYRKHMEMMNLVKVANTSQSHGQFTEEEQIKRNVCGAVLEYRRRDKDVPDKILYKLGVKSFVPEYSMSEELLQRHISNQSQSDVIKRINELRGRQTSSIASKSINKERMQSFDMNRYIALKERLSVRNV